MAAILGTAQAPSVEAAMALTERNSMESNHMALCTADAVATSSRKSTKVGGKPRSAGFSDDIDNDAGPSTHHTIESTRRRSSRALVALPGSERHEREKKSGKLEDDAIGVLAAVEEDAG